MATNCSEFGGAQKVIGVQYLRAVAALLVVFYHASQMVAMPKYIGELPWGGIWRAGFTGVDLFFVLSGYVIVLTAMRDDGTGRLDWLAFAKKRCVRILPMMWLATIAYAGAKSIGRGGVDGHMVMQSLWLMPGGELMPNVLWTLRHEIFFYTLFAIGLCTRISPALLSSILVVVMIAVGQWFGIRSEVDSRLFFAVAGVNLLFVAGACVAYAQLRSIYKTPLSSRVNLILASLCLIVCYMAVERFGYDRGSISAIAVAAIAISVLVFLAAGVCGGEQTQAFKWLEFVGDASYSIYLFHQIAISAVLGFVASHVKGLGSEISFAICVALALVLGSVLHVVVERPMTTWLRRWV